MDQVLSVSKELIVVLQNLSGVFTWKIIEQIFIAKTGGIDLSNDNKRSWFHVAVNFTVSSSISSKLVS